MCFYPVPGSTRPLENLSVAGTITQSVCMAHYKFPQQLFTVGTLLFQNSQLVGMDFFKAIDESYGIDPDVYVDLVCIQ